MHKEGALESLHENSENGGSGSAIREDDIEF